VNGTALQRYAAVTPVSADVFEGAANGPLGKRAYGGLLAAQSLAAACATAPTDRNPDRCQRPVPAWWRRGD
jgi:acyl-CoA thioesterase